jgi:hypothetical protein
MPFCDLHLHRLLVAVNKLQYIIVLIEILIKMNRELKQWLFTITPKCHWKEQLPLTSNHWIQKGAWHMPMEFQVLDWDRHNIWGGVKPLHSISQLSHLTIGSSTAIQIYIKKKHEKICFHSIRPHTIIKMNDNINMDSTIAVSVITS